MNIYLIKKTAVDEPPKIQHAVRCALEDFYRGFELKEVLMAQAADPEGEFFLEGPSGILWIRIYFSPFTPSDLEGLLSEGGYLLRTMDRKITLYAFFPGLSKGSGSREEVFGVLPEASESFDKHFFGYECLWSPRGEALALEEWSPPKALFPQADFSLTERPKISSARTFPFFRRATLAREEIAELLEMSFSLKPLPPS